MPRGIVVRAGRGRRGRRLDLPGRGGDAAGRSFTTPQAMMSAPMVNRQCLSGMGRSFSQNRIGMQIEPTAGAGRLQERTSFVMDGRRAMHMVGRMFVMGLVSGLLLASWGGGHAWAEEVDADTPTSTVAESPAPTDASDTVPDAPPSETPEPARPASPDAQDKGENASETAEATSADKIIRYPSVEIDRAAKEVRVAAKLSPDLHYEPTLLEFILIRNIERAYESAFITDAKPSHVQLGLLLLGLKPGPMPEPEPAGLRSRPLDRPDGEVEGALEQAETAALVDILIRWTEDDGTAKESRIEEFLFSRATGKTPPPTPFAFTGSYFLRGQDGEMQLAADATDAIVAMLYDPHASLNLPFYEGSPYAEDKDAGFVIQTESVPPSFLGEVEIHVIGKKPLPRSDRPVQIVFRPATVAVTLPERFQRAREDALDSNGQHHESEDGAEEPSGNEETVPDAGV